jgi:DNA-binding NarL/FixJ family response regulator
MNHPTNPCSADSGAISLVSPITPAEERVLSALGSGASNRRIAADLVISPRTVESHMSSLLAKTGCRNRTQLLLWAMTRA